MSFDDVQRQTGLNSEEIVAAIQRAKRVLPHYQARLSEQEAAGERLAAVALRSVNALQTWLASIDPTQVRKAA